MSAAGAATPDASLRRRTTISDLAEHLSLTKGTVSRALNDYPDISERTRSRVRKAADQLGYRPLVHAQAIRTGRVRSIGLVVEVEEHDGHRPFLADFLAGLSAGAAAEDWTLTVATAATHDEGTRLLTRLHSERKVDGFILPRTYEADDRVHTLTAAGVPHVLFGRMRDISGAAFFDIAGETAMEQAVLRLAGQGHRRIGFVSGGEGYTYSRIRRDGYFAGLASAGINHDPALLVGPAVSTIDGVEAARVLLSLARPPTAILYSVDRAAFGAYQVAAENGLNVGRDLSVVAYDGVPEGAFLVPPLSTYRVDLRQAGVRLADLLIRLIRGEDPKVLQALSDAEFTPGGSDGPPVLTSAEIAQCVQQALSKGGNK